MIGAPDSVSTVAAFAGVLPFMMPLVTVADGPIGAPPVETMTMRAPLAAAE